MVNAKLEIMSVKNMTVLYFNIERLLGKIKHPNEEEKWAQTIPSKGENTCPCTHTQIWKVVLKGMDIYYSYVW